MKKITMIFALIFSASLFAQEESSQSQGGGFTQMLVMIGIAIVFFYFILWRPEQKRRKAAEEQRSSINKGDKVTAMGIIGTVDKVTDKTVILSMVDGSKIEMLKLAITDVQKSGSAKVEQVKS
jgi:preprotein translocase subunit YajC